MSMIVWRRILRVTLFNDSKDAIVFGNADDVSEVHSMNGNIRRIRKNNLKIEATGTKYLSSMKDEFLVAIYNLDYQTILKIVGNGKKELPGYNYIRIECGYKTVNNGEPIKVFEGGILYASNDRNDFKQNKVILICTSKLIANAGRTRLNLTLKSGLNIYTVFKYLSDKAGIQNAYITEDIKNLTLKNDLPLNGDILTLFDNAVNSSNGLNSSNILAVSTDSTTDANGTESTFNVLSLFKTAKRAITIKASDGLLINNYATITSEGINFTALCTICLSPGDLIRMDNSLINVSFSSKSEALKATSALLKIDENRETDENGAEYYTSYGYYYVWEVKYSLDNTTGDFSQTVICKSKSLLSGIQGNTAS